MAHHCSVVMQALGSHEIRRWIIENDWLEAIVGLPEQLFYNTGINTYIWIVTNRKRPERRGYVQLIDARDLFQKMKKSLGKKRNELTEDNIGEVTRLYESFTKNELSRILPNSSLGYRKITVERPMRVRYDVTDEAILSLTGVTPISNLNEDLSSALIDGLRGLCGTSLSVTQAMQDALSPIFKKAGKVPKPVKTAIMNAIMVRDPQSEALSGVPDPLLRDTENIPLDQDIPEFMDKEILPFAPDAWVDSTKTKIGYDIPFTRQFYRYVPPRLLADIDAEIETKLEGVIDLLREVAR